MAGMLQEVATLPVKGIDGGGNAAVSPGDLLFLTVADSPRISRKATGTVIGRALEPVASGAVTPIAISLIW